MLAGIEHHRFRSVLHLFLEVVVAGHEVVELLHILKGELNAVLSPWCHEEHGLTLEILHILVSEGLVVIVLEDLEAIGRLEFAIVEGFEADCGRQAQECEQQKQL